MEIHAFEDHRIDEVRLGQHQDRGVAEVGLNMGHGEEVPGAYLVAANESAIGVGELGWDSWGTPWRAWVRLRLIPRVDH